jgi:hypothetical protein
MNNDLHAARALAGMLERVLLGSSQGIFQLGAVESHPSTSSSYQLDKGFAGTSDRDGAYAC